jgi:transcriptional regulator with XRE-family HTH domain
MPSAQKEPFTNHLAEIRQSKQLDKKEVSFLLGHKNTTQISQFEQGLRVPDLKTVLKLAQIYNMPIRVMLDEYYSSCRREIEREKLRLDPKPSNGDADGSEASNVDFCTYDRLLASATRNDAELLKVRRHAAYLIRKSAELLGHI